MFIFSTSVTCYIEPVEMKKMAFCGKHYKQKKPELSSGFVRMKGLEPPRLSTLDPKSSAATNYATSASGCKSNNNL